MKTICLVMGLVAMTAAASIGCSGSEETTEPLASSEAAFKSKKKNDKKIVKTEASKDFGSKKGEFPKKPAEAGGGDCVPGNDGADGASAAGGIGGKGGKGGGCVGAEADQWWANEWTDAYGDDAWKKATDAWANGGASGAEDWNEWGGKDGEDGKDGESW